MIIELIVPTKFGKSFTDYVSTRLCEPFNGLSMVSGIGRCLILILLLF